MNFKYIVSVIIIPIVFILDQLSKKWAMSNLKGKPAIDIIDGFFDLRYVENPGAAWGIFGSMSDSLRKPFFIIVSIIAVIFIIYFFIKVKNEQRTLSVAIAFILGGAFGNFYDRVANSYVVDFIHWFYKDYHWPTFNLADSAISTGVVLMIIHMLFIEKEEKREEKKESQGTEVTYDNKTDNLISETDKSSK